jgi:hypothetical protein
LVADRSLRLPESRPIGVLAPFTITDVMRQPSWAT